MRRALEKHIHKNFPYLQGKKILIAISGGIDSVVLTHLFHALHYDISLAHCNFSLRGKESNKDEQFVKALGSNFKLATYTIKFDTRNFASEQGISIQMAARELRYNWFRKISEENNIDYILTAHHKEDVLETFIINLTRGTGIAGLTGIPEVNENVIRPLLIFTRNEILVYATKNKLQWREDQSNSSIKYVRNKIRHKVVPVLKELNPNLLESFNHTLEHLQGSQQVVQDHIEHIQKKISRAEKDAIYFNIAELKKLSKPKYYLYELLKDYGFTEWNDVVDLLSTQSGKQLFSKTHRLLKNRNELILSELTESDERPLYEIIEGTAKIKRPVRLKFKMVTLPANTKTSEHSPFEEIIFDDVHTVSVDADKLTFPLTIRKWQKGDLFYPIGLKGQKKLSKFFKDEKYAITEKENTWLLCSGEHIVWVIGKRLDDRFKITKETNNILKIKHKQ